MIWRIHDRKPSVLLAAAIRFYRWRLAMLCPPIPGGSLPQLVVISDQFKTNADGITNEVLMSETIRKRCQACGVASVAANQV